MPPAFSVSSLSGRAGIYQRPGDQQPFNESLDDADAATGRVVPAERTR